MNAPGRYFPGLDVIRAFACLSVFVGHMFDYINNRTLSSTAESWMYEHFIERSGAMGVSLFFVLSGFLITYLLVREKDTFNTINIRFFYMKRVLRIWPLFFLVTITCFFVIPLLTGAFDGAIVKQHLPWFLFANNFDRINTGFTGINNDNLGVLWSVAVEEQFYFVWPVLVLLIPTRFFPVVCAGLIIASAGFRYVYADQSNILYYHSFSVTGDLAMGGLAAWLGFHSEKFRGFFSNIHRNIRMIILFIIGIVIFNHRYLLPPDGFNVPGRIILCVCFAWLICDQSFAASGGAAIKKSGALIRIGIVSYGFYCYHMFVIMTLQKLNVELGYITISTTMFYIEFVAAFFMTWGISELSYGLFEKQFLKFRDRFDVFKRIPLPK